MFDEMLIPSLLWVHIPGYLFNRKCIFSSTSSIQITENYSELNAIGRYALTLSSIKVFKDKHPPLPKRKGSRELEQSQAQIMKTKQRIVC